MVVCCFVFAICSVLFVVVAYLPCIDCCVLLGVRCSLCVACLLLVVGCWLFLRLLLLVVGCWLLVVGMIVVGRGSPIVCI